MIRLFSVISRTLVGGVLLLCRDAIGVFCQLGQAIKDFEESNSLTSLLTLPNRFGLISLLNGISIFVGCLMSKPFL